MQLLKPSQIYHQKILVLLLWHGLETPIVERRLSERVQFFQVASANEVIPVWVFQRAHAESIPGLLLDFNADGVHILTGKSAPQIESIQAAREAGKQWFRCELMSI